MLIIRLCWLVTFGSACQQTDLYAIGTRCSTEHPCRLPLVCNNGHCDLRKVEVVGGSGAHPASTVSMGGTPPVDTSGELLRTSGGALSFDMARGGASTTGSSASVGGTPPSTNTASSTSTESAGGTSATSSQTGGVPATGGITAAVGGTGGTSTQMSDVPATGGTITAVTQSGGSTAVTIFTGGAWATGGTRTDAGGETSTSTLKKQNGETCSSPAECVSTFCVDSVCCDSRCDGQCQACDLVSGGKCENLVAGEPREGRPRCANADRTCRGECSGSATCSYPDSKIQCSGESRCLDGVNLQTGVACDGSGACSTPIVTPCAAPEVCNINTDNACGKPGYIQVDVSDSHTCAVVSDGTLRCWGANSHRQLGSVDTAPHASPVLVPGVTNARAVATGWLFTCVLFRDGRIDCRGYNCNGGLGCPYDRTDNQHCTDITAGVPAVEVHAGAEHACARFQDGSVNCWGRNDRYSVGDGTYPIELIEGCGDAKVNRFSPVRVAGLQNAASVSVNWWHSCAVSNLGAVRCWGNNNDGSLGVGDMNHRVTATLVSGIDGIASSASAVATGMTHTCALMRDGSLLCFGQNQFGELGDTSTAASTLPVAVESPESAVAVAAGRQFTCALVDPSSIQCWGAGDMGQLGNGDWESSPTPVSARFPSGSSNTAFTSLIAKVEHACALTATGEIWCWGRNDRGQLGNGTAAWSNVPVRVPAPDALH